jgi:DNA helicase HerA-like ATPase
VKGYSNIENLSPLIKRLEKRILDLEKVLTIKDDDSSENKKNLTVVSLRNVNMDIRKMLPMLLVKELYDKKKKDNNKSHSLHIIVDEAHNILSSNSDRESKEWKDYRLETFEEIIKEGRKFNVFMTIASQRPSDISATIISQLHNYFLHRLINNNDLLAVEKTISYLDKVSADSIPNLATGTCILAGLMAKIPVVIKVNEIKKIKNQPQSHNINLIQGWE